MDIEDSNLKHKFVGRLVALIIIQKKSSKQNIPKSLPQLNCNWSNSLAKSLHNIKAGRRVHKNTENNDADKIVLP